MQFQLFQKEIQELTWTPQISENSRKMAENKYNNVPLHMRINQCLEEKRKNLDKLKKSLMEAQRIRDPCNIYIILFFLKNFFNFEQFFIFFLLKVEVSPRHSDIPSFDNNISKFSDAKSKTIKKEEVEKSWEKIKTWYADRNDYITKGQFSKLEKEIEDLTLQPKINKSSKKMMEKVKIFDF